MFSPSSARSHWLLRGQMTSNNKTVSRQKSLSRGNSAKSMTSEGNSALLPANVDRRPPLPLNVFLFVLYNKSLNDWSRGKQFILFPSTAPRGNIEILGNQNELFPSGPVIECLLFLCKEPAKTYCIMGWRKCPIAWYSPLQGF